MTTDINVTTEAADMSYDLIDRFLRNNLYDDDYKEYSAALDELYTPKRLQVGLTDEEFNDAINYKLTPRCIAIAIEAKLKEKNA